MMNNQEWNSNSNSSSIVDVSSFLLFESTGDSEFDSNIFSTSDDPMNSLNPSHQHFLEDDDAQSCSYDNEDMELDFKIQNNDDNDDDDDGDDSDDDVDIYSRFYSRGFHRKSIGWNSNMEDEDEDEDEGGVVEQRSMNNNGVNRCNEKLKTNVCSSVVVVDCELKSQKDKDKLFWETCLAS